MNNYNVLSKVSLFIGILFCTVVQIPPSHSANIVFFFALSSYSHRIAVWPLVEKLADLGHNVTFIQPHKPKHPHPKVLEILPDDIAKLAEEMESHFDNLLMKRLEQGRMGTLKEIIVLPWVTLGLCDTYLSSPEIRDWIKNSKVDLIVIDQLFNECGLGLAHKFGAKFVFFASTTMLTWTNDEFGYPTETSWIPEVHVPFPYPMTFIQRTITTLLTVGASLAREWIYFPKLETMLREKLDIPNMPPISEMMKKTSLVLMNSHFSEDLARSFPPLVIPIGGMHCDVQGKKNVIPKEIESFINGTGESGFIYVSFGSVVNIATSPEYLRNIFYTAFSNSKARFVWKWNGPRPKEMPPNIITAEWLPQREILSHPKIKAFISHGGLLSIQEAIKYEVPMIVFPVFAEQDYNSFRIERTGRGLRLEIENLTLEKLQDSISEILKNPSYKSIMKKTSTVSKDRPQKPLDTAIWWIDYVLRHEDTSHLMPLGIDQTWYQRRLLDVWAVVALVVLSTVLLVLFIIKKLLGFLFSIIFSSGISNNSKPQSHKTVTKVKKS